MATATPTNPASHQVLTEPLCPVLRPDFPFGTPGPGRWRSPGIWAPEALARCSRLRFRLRFPRPGTERPPPVAAGVAGGGAARGPRHPGSGGRRWPERCAELGPAAVPPWAPPPPRPRWVLAAWLAALGRPGAGGGPGRMPLPGPPRRPLSVPRLPGRLSLAPHSPQPRSPRSCAEAPWSARRDPPTPGPLGSGSLRPPPLNWRMERAQNRGYGESGRKPRQRLASLRTRDMIRPRSSGF